MMNIACPICSELLKESSDTVATTCGHVFHRECLESWLKAQYTCPTCRRENTSPRSLIKLFFEFDDNKANLNLEEILKNNDELAKKNKEEEQKARDLEEKLRVLEVEQKKSEEKVKTLERQKQFDDMAIAGLKNIKDETVKEVVRLNETVTILKLDLLAEKQLRRMHQLSLHDFDPQNVNYNTDNIIAEQEQSTSETNQTSTANSASKVILPFWKLNCEAKSDAPMKIDTSKAKKPAASYAVPNKIQKATRDTIKSVKRLSGQRDPNLSLRDLTQPGFQFNLPETPLAKPTQSCAPTSTTSTTPLLAKGKFSFGASSMSLGTPIFSPPVNAQTSKSFLFNVQAQSPTNQSTTATNSPLQGFTLGFGNQPSTSKVALIANNQKRVFAEEPKFCKAVPESTVSNKKMFDFSVNAPTFRPSTPISPSLQFSPISMSFNFSSLTHRGNLNPIEIDSESSEAEPNLVNGPKTSDR